jgi:vacuolar-type H+-ATPase subunit E/Vma4
LNLVINYEERLSKAAIQKTANALTEEILQYEDALDATIKLRAMRDAISIVLADIEIEAMEVASRYGKDDKAFGGTTVSVRNGSVRYDYSGDATWAEIQSQLKARERLLKGVKEEIIVKETGEIVKPPQVNYTKSSLTVSFPKE